MAKHPVVVGLKVCKDVIVDEKTRHVTLVNCIRKLRVASVPTSPQDFTICAALVDGFGEMNVTLKVSFVSTSKTLFDHTWRVKFTDPLEERWMYINLKKLVFPFAGKYEFLLLADGEWLACNTVSVLVEGASL